MHCLKHHQNSGETTNWNYRVFHENQCFQHLPKEGGLQANLGETLSTHKPGRGIGQLLSLSLPSKTRGTGGDITRGTNNKKRLRLCIGTAREEKSRRKKKILIEESRQAHHPPGERSPRKNKTSVGKRKKERGLEVAGRSARKGSSFIHDPGGEKKGREGRPTDCDICI